MLQLILSQRAQDDLRDIKRVSRRDFGDNQTRTYLRLIRSALDAVARFPESSPVAHINGAPSRYRARIVRHGSHVIYYMIGKHEIFVVRILHSRMDAPRHL